MDKVTTVHLMADDVASLRRFAEGERLRGGDANGKLWHRVFTALCIAGWEDEA